MRAQLARAVLVAGAVLALPVGARADEAAAIKAVEAAGGKLTFWKNSDPRTITLTLDGCPRADEALAKLDTLAESVTYLRAGNSGLTDAGLKLLARGPRLKELAVARTAVTDAGLAHLKGLPIEVLDLRDTKVTADGLKALGALPRLSRLQLGGPVVTDATLKRVAELNLAWLELADSAALTDAGVAALHARKTLSNVSFSNCPVSADALAGFKGGNLFALGYRKQKLTPGHVAALKGLNGVQALDLSETGYSFTGAEGFERLIELTFTGNPVPPACAKAIGGMTKLRTLNLSGCDLGDAALPELAALKQVLVLDLSGTQVTDKGLPALNGATQLRYLYLRKTAVTNPGARALKAALPGTHIITDLPN